MRADRLLSILLLLQVHHRMTARALAERLEVSERTIHRDMESLSAAGVPVHAERGRGGGWILPKSYRTNLTGLNDAEVRSLFLAKPARVLADLGLGKAADAALVKLLVALPSAHRRDAEHARRRIHVDASGWRRPEEAVPCLPALQAAVWQERRVRITYARPDGSAVERLVDPFGLVAKGSLWYLIGAVEGEPRTYRVSRVQSVQVTDQPFECPEDFDLASYWAESSAGFVAGLPRYAVTVRVAPELLPQIMAGAGFARVEHVAPADAGGWSSVRLAVQTEDEACAFVLSFGTRIEVLEPPELRERVIDLAVRVTEFYGCRSPA